MTEEKLEDKIFLKALEAKGIKRTKKMYERAEHPHRCSMCQCEEDITINDLRKGYRLTIPYVSDFNEPYIFICDDCYKELPDD